MADEATRTLQWVEKIFVECNQDPTYEFEIKFCDRFQGLVSEDPGEFQVGVNAFLFHQLIAHFRALPDAYAEEQEDEVVKYLSSGASEISGPILANSAVFQRYGADLRVVSRPNRPRFVMIKTRIKQLPDAQQSVLPEGFKMSLSKEAILSDEEAVSVFATFDELSSGVFTHRDKKRMSFVQHIHDDDRNSIRVLKIDFTAVTTSFGEHDVTDLDSPTDNIRYEIELEYIGNKSPNGGTDTLQQSRSLRHRIARLFFDNIHQLIRLIQGSPIPLNNMAHNAVIRNYLESVGNNDPYAESAGVRPSSKDMFVGCQPESLHERHLPSLVRERYFVTSKTDGLRFQLIAIPQPDAAADQPHRMRCYLIDRWMHVQPSGLRIAVPNAATAAEIGFYDGFLLDGELVTEPDGSETYWPFDVLRFGAVDMRPRLTFARLEVLKKIVGAVQRYGIKAPNRLPPMTIQLKDIIFWPNGEASSGDLVRLLEQSRTPSDGLICMRDEPHPRKRQWPGLLKWKGTQSTVDLYVRKNVEGKRWDLFVGGNFATIKRDGSRCLIFKKIPTENKDNLYWVLTPSGPTIIEQASRDLVWSDVRSCIPFPFCASIPSYNHVANGGMVALEDKMVFEFCYDPQHNTLVPKQKRTDKSMRGLDGANDLRVAVDVWESMKYAVTKEQLLSLPTIQLSSPERAAIGTYPYIKDIDARIDWKALFSGASQPVVGSGTASSSSTGSAIVNMKQLHNRIKQKLIAETRKKKPLNSTDILKSLDGFVVSSRDRLQPTQIREWSLPKTARIALQKMWGLRPESIVERGDRIYVSERLLNGAKIVQPHETVVVDLCCGKGGDLGKYVRTDMSVLVCIDNEKALLTDLKDSALRRWEEIRARDTFTDACFVLADCRQPLYQTLCDRGIPLEADVVSCFFALHYFFSCERDARSFLQNVKDLLKPDGRFIGTMVDGELMFEQLRKHGGSFTHLGGGIYPIFSVTAVNFDPTAKEFRDLPLYGQHLDVELKSSILEQYSTAKAESASDAKQENLVGFDMLTDLAAQYDLELVQTQTFNQYFPDWPEIPLTDQIAAYSATHRSFCFRKLSKSANAGRETFSAIRSTVRRLWSTQVAARAVVNDIRSGVYAHSEAYPDDAIVRRLSEIAFTAPDAAADAPDDDSSSSEEPPKRVVAAPPPPKAVKRPIKEEDPDEEPEEPEESEAPEPASQKKQRASVVVVAAAKKNQGCSARCSGGDCRGCVCRRTHHAKCHSGCQCGPNCQNR